MNYNNKNLNISILKLPIVKADKKTIGKILENAIRDFA